MTDVGETRDGAAALRLEGVCKGFAGGDGGRIQVLDGVSLRLERGELGVITGPSGSGKSTLLNVAALMDRADAGEVWLDGKATSGLSDRERARLRGREIGFVFQRFHLLPRRSVLENVLFRFRYAGVPKGMRAEAAAREALERVGMAGLAGRTAGVLSAGEMQRVAIARAIVLPPTLLLADEPTGNLDARNAEGIMELFRSLNAEGLSMLVVTHAAAWERLDGVRVWRMRAARAVTSDE